MSIREYLTSGRICMILYIADLNTDRDLQSSRKPLNMPISLFSLGSQPLSA